MKKRRFSAELAYILGLVLLGLGTAFIVKTNFGVSMVVAPAYLLHLKISPYLPFFTFGVASYTVQFLLVAALSIALPLWASALIMAAFYLILILSAIVCRKQLFINPFVRRLSQIFFAREKQEMEEEQLRREAEND